MWTFTVLALSHIVSGGPRHHDPLVQEIKAEEAELDGKLADYESFWGFGPEDEAVYRACWRTTSLQGTPGLSGCGQRRQQDPGGLRMANGTSRRSAAPSRAWTPSPPPSPPRRRRPGSRLLRVYIVSLVTSAVTLAPALCWLWALSDHPEIRHRPHPERHGHPAGQLQRISGVVGERRSGPAPPAAAPGPFSGLNGALSAPWRRSPKHRHQSPPVPPHSGRGRQHWRRSASAITSYSAQMRGRAEEMERSAQAEMEAVQARRRDHGVLNEAIEKSRSRDPDHLVLTEDILPSPPRTEPDRRSTATMRPPGPERRGGDLPWWRREIGVWPTPARRPPSISRR